MSITFHTATSPESMELNVANGNGYTILRDLLDQGPDPESYGDLDPNAVLRSLALSSSRVRGMVRPTRDNGGEEVVLSTSGVSVKRVCRVIECGLGEEQIERYIVRLEALATYAAERGELIAYD